MNIIFKLINFFFYLKMCDINTSTLIPQGSGSIMKAARTVEEES